MNKIIIVMGVSGSGKTTIGKGIAKVTGIPFYDADDFHPAANISKMAAGIPLTDADREPWLILLSRKLKQWQSNQGAVLACSALKESYRSLLRSQLSDIKWICLTGDFETIHARMLHRSHFMKPEMLRSQFETLELPSYGLHCAIDLPKRRIIELAYAYSKG